MSIFRGSSNIKQFFKTNPVSAAMIVLVTIGYMLQLLFRLRGIELIDYGAVVAFDIIDRVNGDPVYSTNVEVYRFVTAIFLHGNFLHYLFNTFFGLFIISSALERLIGPKKFAVVLGVAGIGASAVVYGWNHIFEIGVPTIGASGAIFGAMGFLFYLTMVRPHWFSAQDIASVRGLIFINILFTFLAANISIPGHLGGLGMGFLLAFLLVKDAEPHHRVPEGFGNPYDPYQHENWAMDDLDDVELIDDDDDDDDDDRRIW